MMEELDGIDKMYVDQFLPEGTMFAGLVSIVMFMDEDGNIRWRPWCTADIPCSTVIGVLETAKHHFIQKWGVLPEGRGDDG